MSEDPAARPTAYLPSGRAARPVEPAEVARVSGHPLVSALLRAGRAAVAVVDGHRQIVATNARFLAVAGARDPASVLGLRLGETLACVAAREGPDGCGTGASCAGCGVAFALLAGLRDRAGERECALRVGRGGVPQDLALRVVAVPFRVSAEPFVALLVSDVTQERCRSALGRLSASAARSAARLRDACGALRRTGDAAHLAEVEALADRVRGELAVHALLAGEEVPEEGLPPLRALPVDVAVRRVAGALRAHPASAGRGVELEPMPPDARVLAEPAALHHVLLAMAVNALEATPPGGTVRLAVADGAHHTTVRVWNAGVVPAVVGPRLFQRHFTTKEAGRGHGTWSMRLLAERVLGARVTYASSREGGTSFLLVLQRVDYDA